MNTISKNIDIRSLEEKKNILRRLLRERSSKTRTYSLSSGQSRLWLLGGMSSESQQYHIPALIRVKGALDVNLFKECLVTLSRRHDCLRTRFPVRNGKPVQEFNPEMEFDFSFESIEDQGSEELACRIARERIDIEIGPCWRCRVLKPSENVFLIVIVFHHIIADGWSLNIFWRELVELYRSNRDESLLIPLESRYSDFVEAEAESLRNGSWEEDERYWRKRLYDVPALLELPWSRSRTALASFKGRRLETKIDLDSLEEIEILTRWSKTTVFSFLLAVYRILLFRYSGQEDFCIGIPVANRESSKFSHLFGFLINTLALRNRFKESATFVSFLKSTNREIREGIAHQALPLARVLEVVQPVRNPSFNPLFQAMFIMQNAPKQSIEVSGLQMDLEELDVGVSKFDLTLETSRRDDGLSLIFEYNTDLFDESIVSLMAESYKRLLDSAIHGMQVAIKRLKWISLEEEQLVLHDWNRTKKDYNSDSRFETLFEVQAQRRPKAVATTCFRFGRSLSYSELDRQATRFARFLIARGVKQAARVGVCLDRSTRILVSLLGIFKAKASYVPLDPSFPNDRLEFMANDAELSHFVFEGSIESASTVACNLDVIRIDWDHDKEAIESGVFEPLELTGSSDDVAYTIYTSGSTGRPKGVQIQHRALVNFLSSMAEEPGINEDDRLLSLTTLSFDISMLEFFLPLLVGAEVVIADKGLALDGRKLSREINSRGINYMQATPASWRLLLDSGWTGTADLKMLCGGEALPRDLAMRLTARGSELWNMYGPTETTIWSSVRRIRKDDTEVFIGSPIANTRFYVLGKDLSPLPRGVVGELYIGGDGLSLGYWKRPELIKKAFVPSPFDSDNGKPIYRTGDLVKWRDNGCLQFIGRADHQVKVRGFRIELGEIEVAISKLEMVKQCACLVREDRPGDQRIAAYVIMEEGMAFDESIARKALRESLPHYMIPSFFVTLIELPQTPNGKIDLKRLPKPGDRPVLEESVPISNAGGGLLQKVSDIFKEVLGVDQINPDDNFFDLGGHSMLLADLHAKLEPLTNRPLEIVDFFRFPSVRALVDHLEEIGAGESFGDMNSGDCISTPSQNDSIAIIGMSCRFPGASNVDEFWQLLIEGKEGISDISEEQALKSGVDPALLEDPKYVRRFGILKTAELFDAEFFGYRPREAEMMDPQQRVFLEICHEGLEDAKLDPQRFKGSIGVFGGVGMNTYGCSQIDTGAPDRLSDNYQAMIGNDKDFLATRVAYRLNLSGPAISVQTACSTSLVAVHLACESLKKGETDVALAGGASIRFPQDIGYVYEEGMILSPDGRCRAFDEKAQGTVGGSGAGIVVLKRLSKAREDGDRIYAVIKGSAVNNDGALKVGYTAPSPEGQSKAISAALFASGVDPDSIGYIEAHGTGTSLGDPIEILALEKSYGRSRAGGSSCAIGSVKTNIGHLDTAAGIAGLIKAALTVNHGKIPESLWFEKANPKLKLGETSFYVNSQLSAWDDVNGPRRAGVSSFGIGGTNAHLILEQADESSLVTGEKEPELQRATLLCVSAKTSAALRRQCQNLYDHLQKDEEMDLGDLAFTLNLGRSEYAYRTSFVCADREEALEQFRVGASANSADSSDKSGKVVFMFSGQGSQYRDMGRTLYEDAPLFREIVDQCFDAIEADLGVDPREIVFPKAEASPRSADLLSQTRFAQPILFVIEYALARYWQSLGVRPSAMIGHSVGEYVCACLSDVLSESDALSLICARGRLMQSMPTGSMLAISESPEVVTEFAAGMGLDLAAVNSARSSVISGDSNAIEQAKRELDSKDILYRDLHTSHAFHSRMMDGMLAEFEEMVSAVAFKSPKIPYISNLTGDWIADRQLKNTAYWRDHLRSTVRFADGIETLLESKPTVLLEVGPGLALRTFAAHQSLGSPVTIETSLPHPKESIDSHSFFLNSLGRLWEKGVNVDWQAFHADLSSKKIGLPFYPFERKRFRLEDADSRSFMERGASRRQPISRWMYAPVWQRSVRVACRQRGQYKRGLVFVFSDESGFLEDIADKLSRTGKRIIKFTAGKEYRESKNGFRIRPDDLEDYNRAFHSIGDVAKEELEQVLHGWNISACENMAKDEKLPFYSLLCLSQAIGNLGSTRSIEIRVFANRTYRVIGDEQIDPMKSLIAGPIRVTPQEFDLISCQSVDMLIPTKGSAAWGSLVDDVCRELESPIKDKEIAFRGGSRWTQSFQVLEDDFSSDKMNTFNSSLIKDEGVYWIVGGLGGMGYVFARHIAERRGTKLLITGRLDLPSSDEWKTLSHKPSKEGLASGKLLALKEACADVLYVRADITDVQSLMNARDLAIDSFGTVNGVVHAAGVPGGGLILGKRRDSAQMTLNPKVRGTLALDECLKELPLDFLLLCSSVTSENGGIGQVDYCSANAFLDAYAQRQAKRADERLVTSVQWDAWSESGMAARTIRSPKLPEGSISVHPLVGRPIYASDKTTVFTSQLQASEDWVLNEHWILGQATVPGTTYLEMARAAVAHALGDKVFLFSEVYFMSPLSCDRNETTEVRTVLQRIGDKFAFTVLSRTDAIETGFWKQHLTLDISALRKGTSRSTIDLESLKQRCSFKVLHDARQLAAIGHIVPHEDGKTHSNTVEFGPRWNTLSAAWLGEGEGLARLELGIDYIEDLYTFPLHPALLDCSTAFLRLVRQEGVFLPLSYERIAVYGDLSPIIYSHAVEVQHERSEKGTASFDVWIYDEAGTLLVEITRFTLREIDEESLASSVERTILTSLHIDSSGNSATELQKEIAKKGIKDAEGVVMMNRILNAANPQVLVSTHDYQWRKRQFDELRLGNELTVGAARKSQSRHARPDLKTPYVAPSKKTELGIAELWESLLGIEGIGALDDVFELGSDSLLLVQFHKELVKRFQTNVSVVDLYKYTTVRDLAKRLDQGAVSDSEKSVVMEKVDRRASKAKGARSRRKKRSRNEVKQPNRGL